MENEMKIAFSMAMAGLSLNCMASDAKAPAANSCQTIADDAERLVCYDKAFSSQPRPAVDPVSPRAAPMLQAPVEPAASTSLSRHWELDAADKKGTWTFRPHKQSYFLLGRYTSNVNNGAYESYFSSVKDKTLGIDDTEAKFQLSFKVKAFEQFIGNSDLWLGYTQQNHWQVYNKGISAPFRETNYEPEVFLAVPINKSNDWMSLKLLNIGFVHQSNGQSHVLSRSWNRVYLQTGMEFGNNLSLYFKPWYRLPEEAEKDDNPDIDKYIGNYELAAVYGAGRHVFTATGRSTFGLKKGSLQLDWSFPLQGRLKGYVQATSGYGESLIDYNHRQTTFGLGVILSNWND